ncbi:MAG: ABC transporter permease [Bacteroidota bacterium]
MTDPQIHIAEQASATLWQRWMAKWSSRWAFGYLVAMVFMALFAPILSNDQPLYVVVDGERYWPAFSSKTYGKGQNKAPWENRAAVEQEVRALIPYGPAYDPLYDAHKDLSPWGEQAIGVKKDSVLSLRNRHWMGTENDGQDVFAQIIHGSRLSLTVGLVVVGLASLLGLLLGGLAGYYGDQGPVVSRAGLWLAGLALPLVWFYGWHIWSWIFGEAKGLAGLGVLLFRLGLSGLLLGLFYALGSRWRKNDWLGRRFALPVDSLVSRLIEILRSLPVLLILLAFVALYRPGTLGIMVLLGVLAWPGIARLTRGEMLRVKGMEYMASAQALGLSNRRLLFRHAFPNVMAPIWPAIFLGMGSAMLAEAVISFLDLGFKDAPSWGRAIAASINHFDMWWVALFPGLFLFFTVLALNILGDALRDALDPFRKK